MSEKCEVLTVVLDEKKRKDDLKQGIVNAIIQIKGVEGVEFERTSPLEKSTLRKQLRSDLHESINRTLEEL